MPGGSHSSQTRRNIIRGRSLPDNSRDRTRKNKNKDIQKTIDELKERLYDEDAQKQRVRNTLMRNLRRDGITKRNLLKTVFLLSAMTGDDRVGVDNANMFAVGDLVQTEPTRQAALDQRRKTRRRRRRRLSK